MRSRMQISTVAARKRLDSSPEVSVMVTIGKDLHTQLDLEGDFRGGVTLPSLCTLGLWDS